LKVGIYGFFTSGTFNFN